MFGIKLKHFFQISNLLSIIRLLGAFPLVWIIFNPGTVGNWGVVAIVFFLGLTDFLDGFLARKLNQVTELGKILDPLADKVLVISIAVSFFITGIIDPLLFAVIVARDLLIMLPGIFLGKKLGSVPASDMIGKWTFAFIGVYLLIVYLGGNGNNPVPIFDKNSTPMVIYYYFLILLIIVSFLNYAAKAIKLIKESK
ncbi:MAG: CDP-alcohol phosphatidyltransferase family protein [Ignavibacteriales bacterium]|nr:MAG: CDP-alcohol phosphatidyltransferase family protein [Ignavibacteriaceae bacterium]MBW7872330.1 CDP-alcohol phosphatidyltransferase family protein [Ignavibacteria bacterium]MCZ2142613.1 CDP-alcohol phosphatidyltransferase family protein [Ignavibacteriales bacterium]OQY74581.1 MAG: hypothetical protein B6D45_06750 [Ignavibacteriales bacterium UTCHB3]MBV6445523.1 CDP-diacylglycerol--glycerol-3-phosphate 3-phosphatidyltransferase [Ignavibacteriaceae bacterium]